MNKLKKIILFSILVCMMALVFSCKADCNKENLTVKSESTTIDCNLYLQKTWIIKDSVNFVPSLYITKMENGTIEGKWSLSLILLDCYTDSFTPTEYGSFQGTIHDEVAQCDFTDEFGDGTVMLLFKEDNIIEATIHFTNKKYSDKEYPEGNYIFQPYTIEDYGAPTELQSYPVDLNSWGNVYITTGYVTAQHPYAVAYITDESNNILYEFKGLSNGWKISEISIEDINNDGLKDVWITLDTPSVSMVYLFVQMSNGLFYDSKLDSDPNISNLAPLP